MKRVVALLPVLIAFQAGAPPALAWTWPADGPVLRPFVLGDDPYAGGQHRGVDLAGASGAAVPSPATGVVSFAGTVPGSGRSVTVETADGYSVTLVHLGSIGVERAAAVDEGMSVGTIGPTGDAEHSEPYVHLGIRVTSDPHGYLNPLDFLPDRDSLPAPAPPPAAEPVPAAPPIVVPGAPPPVSEPPPPAEVPAPEPGAAPAPEGPEREASAGVGQRTHGVAPAEILAPTAARAARVPLDRRAGHAQTVRGQLPGRLPPSPPGGTGVDSFGLRASPPGGAEPHYSAELALARSAADQGFGVTAAAVASVAGLLALVTGSAACRQLSRARAAHAPTSVLDDQAGRATEDTRAARPAQEDRLILDRDFEGVTLGQPEALSDLDRDHDPAELVEVANDACRRLPTTIAPWRIHRVGRRPSSRCRKTEIHSAR
jgi:hypothetical protein